MRRCPKCFTFNRSPYRPNQVPENRGLESSSNLALATEPGGGYLRTQVYLNHIVHTYAFFTSEMEWIQEDL